MLNTINYDSLYKFIVSIGLFFFIIPVIIIGWILTNNDVILLSADEINKLTNTARQIIDIQQQYKYAILANPIIIIIILLIFWIIGLSLIIYGINKWNINVQQIEDKSKLLSNKIQELEIEKMTYKEQKEKIENEMRIENNSKEIDYYNKYYNMQELVYKSIKNVFIDYKVLDEVKVRNVKYDCIAYNDFKTYIFEIKYYRSNNFLKARLSDIISKIAENEVNYLEVNKRYAKSIAIIVFDKIDEEFIRENRKIIEIIDKYNKDKELYNNKIIITTNEKLKSDLKEIYNWK